MISLSGATDAGSRPLRDMRCPADGANRLHSRRCDQRGLNLTLKQRERELGSLDGAFFPRIVMATDPTANYEFTSAKAPRS